jgi:hypothetical protein
MIGLARSLCVRCQKRCFLVKYVGTPSVYLMHAGNCITVKQTHGASCRACFVGALRMAIFYALLRKTLRISDKTWSFTYAHKWASGILSRALAQGPIVEKGETSDLLGAKVGFCLLPT